MEEKDLSINRGSEHPLSMLANEAYKVFMDLGFEVANGPELEKKWYNFDALNVPLDHPARDMQDSFYIKNDTESVLRTHNTNTTAHSIESLSKKGEYTGAFISIGKVFRNEATDATHEMQFFQIDGCMIGENISMSDLKGVLTFFYKKILGDDVMIEFRPSFFPFTEPSAEVDVSCFICNGKGCNICKHSGWVEILGCGMVDPAVLKNCNIDTEKYAGFAFGMGIERITMLKYQINDLRLFSENDVRFLKQFQSA